MIDSTAVGRSVTAIEVRRDNETQAERLQVHGMMPEALTEKFFFGATDLNGDGNFDLMIATSRGVANTYADYWRFVPATGTFAYLGNFPEFTIDSTTKRLKTYERGGAGGRHYQSKEWAFDTDSLIVMREEVQEAGAKSGEFVRIVRERIDSAGRSVLRQVSKERVRNQ